MVKPQEQHPRRVRDRTLLGERPVFALGVAVNVGDGGDAWVAQRSTSFTPRGIHIAPAFFASFARFRRAMFDPRHDRFDEYLDAFFMSSNDIDGLVSRSGRDSLRGQVREVNEPDEDRRRRVFRQAERFRTAPDFRYTFRQNWKRIPGCRWRARLRRSRSNGRFESRASAPAANDHVAFAHDADVVGAIEIQHVDRHALHRHAPCGRRTARGRR